MTKLHIWWQSTPRAQKPLLTVLLYTLLFAGGLALGRELFQFTH